MPKLGEMLSRRLFPYLASILLLAAAAPLAWLGGVWWSAGALVLAALSFFTTRSLVRQRKMAEKPQWLLDEGLLQTQKLAALGELAAGVAHEINNPLAIIRQEAEWLRQLLEGQRLRDAPEWGEIQDSLREIIQQVERSREITHNLLNLARPREPVIQEVNLNKLVADMSALVEREAGQHNIKIVRDLQSDLPLLYSDPPLLRQVILNLLNNAQQAIQQDGVISIATRSTPDGYVNLTVTDTGGGIAAEDLPKIFHPFFTTKPPGQGTGLGLAICHRILDELGGRIAVASQVGQGATFTVSLPLKAKKDQD
jgi:two-component system NtrC family sensor kinase